ncbi:MAG: hypothetical protein NZ772_19340 [Cyanobacteria bacterium]|nr:hypothetical protein [Cyanobacteriota bacterium]MDW8203346.1 hypothetical protein [Cyanobacteriota bacterium SKYGB_h_bin112]
MNDSRSDSSLQFVLSQFRTSYPNGSLVTQLLQTHNDYYLVRAIVRLGETVVATGMAAAPTVEQAEDRARIRALEVLGILPLPAMPAVTTPPSVASSPLQPETSANQANPSQTPTLPNSVAHDLPHPSSTAKPNPLTPRPQPSRSLSSPARHATPASSTEPPTGKREPIDLSEIIDQTGIEMKRLGWSTEQRRQYLKQQFGKESRQQLSADELEHFLNYLKRLP